MEKIRTKKRQYYHNTNVNRVHVSTKDIHEIVVINGIEVVLINEPDTEERIYIREYLKRVPDLVQPPPLKYKLPEITVTESPDYGFPKPSPQDLLKLHIIQ